MSRFLILLSLALLCAACEGLIHYTDGTRTVTASGYAVAVNHVNGEGSEGAGGYDEIYLMPRALDDKFAVSRRDSETAFSVSGEAGEGRRVGLAHDLGVGLLGFLGGLFAAGPAGVAAP